MFPHVCSNSRCLLMSLAALLLATSLTANNLGASASFEEDQRPLAPARYAWRNSGFAASIQAGGTVSLTSEDGPSAPLTFPGAALTPEPRGEGETVQKAHYYVGPAENWRSATHFDRVRYAQIYPGIDLRSEEHTSELQS